MADDFVIIAILVKKNNNIEIAMCVKEFNFTLPYYLNLLECFAIASAAIFRTLVLN